MKKYGVIFSISIFLLVMFAGFFGRMNNRSLANPLPQIKEHRISIKKIHNKWKTVDALDNSKTRVVAKRGEKIVWTAEGSDLYFQFMDDKLFGDYTKVLKNGKQLVLVIGKNARKGSNRYAVFCLSDKEFATGNSPPEIVVE